MPHIGFWHAIAQAQLTSVQRKFRRVLASSKRMRMRAPSERFAAAAATVVMHARQLAGRLTLTERQFRIVESPAAAAC